MNMATSCASQYIIQSIVLLPRGENAFPTAHSLSYGGDGKVAESAIDRMVEDLDKQ